MGTSIFSYTRDKVYATFLVEEPDIQRYPRHWQYERHKTTKLPQKPAQWSQQGGQKQYRTKYRTVSTSRRRYTHRRCRTNPTTRNEKTADKTKKYVTTTKTAGKLYPTIPCNNPDSDTGWKTQLSLSNRKNRRTPTSAIIQRNSQLNIRWTSTHR